MSIRDFFNKFRALLEGDAEEEVYTPEEQPERRREQRAERRPDSASHIAERMAGKYAGGDEEDDDESFDNTRTYRSPRSYQREMDDEYDDVDASTNDDYYDDEEDEEDDYEAAPYVRREIDLRDEPAAPAAEREEAQPERLPTRTEVTLQQIARLSKQLDEETLREYQTRLVRYKQENGAVSALTALRILNEYVQDDAADDADVSGGPSLTVKD